MTDILYHPKGSMCINCGNWMKDCHKLDFQSMRPLDKYEADGKQYIEVKCNNYKNETK